MRKVLVIGASQGIGKAVCEAAAAAGHHVRGMSRSGKAARRRDDRIEAFKGDALSQNDVERALDGMDIVVQALGVPASLDMVTKPVTLFSDATRILLPAMEKCGVKRLISVTGFGAGDCSSAINLLQRIPFRAFLGRAYDDKTKQEAMIEASELDWMFVRPGVLTNGAMSNLYRVLTDPKDWRNGIVSRADVADYITSQLDAEELNGRKPVIIRYPL